jgi:putative peptidoglycan lipid II flippase
VRGGLVVGAGILAGNIVGFVRVGVTAWFLGTHAHADALAVAVGPVDTLSTAIINTLLVSFVPMLMLRGSADRAAMFQKAAHVFTGVLAAISAAVFALAPQFITLLGPGLAAEQHDQATLLLRVLAPGIFFSGTSAIFAALLYTERRFIIPAFYQACVNGATILGAMFLWKLIGVYGFAVGYTLGTATQLILTWSASRGLARSLKGLGGTVPGLSEILIKPGMFLLYAALISANILVTRAFATHGGPGMAAAFDYCLRCISVVVAYLVYPVANSLVPEIAQLQRAHNSARAFSLIGRSMRLMAACAIAACGLGLLVRTQAIEILFQRGSFTHESTLLVSAVFLGFAPAIVGWALMDLGSRCLFALDRTRLPVLAALVAVTINVVVMLVFGWPYSLNHPSMLAVGASTGLLVGFAALYVSLKMTKLAQVLEPEPAEVVAR